MTQPASERVHLTAQTLKGVAHPIRLRLLGLLREDGPSTATKLAERIGQSSGVTSYHLRQLAQFGFVEDATEQASGGRERWWKAAHRATSLEADQVREAPVEAEAYMRAIANAYADRMDRWLGEMPLIPREWDESATFSDVTLRLTAAEAAEVVSRMTELMSSYRHNREDVPAPEGAERVSVQIQVMPFLRASAAIEGTSSAIEGTSSATEATSAGTEGTSAEGIQVSNTSAGTDGMGTATAEVAK